MISLEQHSLAASSYQKALLMMIWFAPPFLPDQVSGLCFDAACQQQADKAFLIALVLPLVFGGLAILYILRQFTSKGCSFCSSGCPKLQSCMGGKQLLALCLSKEGP
eukprot:scaffold88117_cov18-Tisochrysis_lutea.AAC.1